MIINRKRSELDIAVLTTTGSKLSCVCPADVVAVGNAHTERTRTARRRAYKLVRQVRKRTSWSDWLQTAPDHAWAHGTRLLNGGVTRKIFYQFVFYVISIFSPCRKTRARNAQTAQTTSGQRTLTREIRKLCDGVRGFAWPQRRRKPRRLGNTREKKQQRQTGWENVRLRTPTSFKTKNIKTTREWWQKKKK